MSTNFDHSRKNRTGIPEIVLAEPKTVKDLLDSVRAGLSKNETLLVSRINQEQIDPLTTYLEKEGKSYILGDYKRTLMIGGNIKPDLRSSVAILSAGTSDGPLVEEVRLTLNYLGISAVPYSDIGVAGYDRHQVVLPKIHENKGIQCIIVIAGQDGALFPVISGQTHLPVIAVPSPVGYGFGGKGETALMTALQSCSPGVGVVNIGNGIGAAALAAKIINLCGSK